MSPAPIYISARGAVSGFGFGVATLLDGVFGGRSAIRPLRRLKDAPDVRTTVAAELPPGVLDEVSGGDAGELPFRLACFAAEEALADLDEEERDDLALVLATTKGDLRGAAGEGDGLGSPRLLADRVAAALDAGGFRSAVSVACASGLAACALAARRLREGDAKRALVIGVDALSPFVLAGFSDLLALDPGPCRPFSRDRKGLSLGDGAGALLLTVDPAESGGVAILGWGESNDANHVTGPSRDGAGLCLAAQRALDAAGVPPAEVDLIHLHGTGTAHGDASEAKALASLFGGPTPPAFGTKAQTGHTLGAAGVLETIIAIEALERGEAPPNLGLERSDVEGELTLLRRPKTLARSRTALKVSAGFGGIDAALVLRRSDET